MLTINKKIMGKRKFKYEGRIINPILRKIRDNTEYLIQPENLPQLAKLGYMYNHLFYSGRVCWGNEGVIEKQGDWGQCEDNPKYFLEKTNPRGYTLDEVYDAWGMHVSNGNGPSWDRFRGIVVDGKELNDWHIRMLKTQKTVDDWVSILSDKIYKYSQLYSTRKSVLDNLLCVIGNEYGFKDGYVIREASGADQDEAMYGDWENCVFRKDIKVLVDKIMADPITEQTIQTSYEFIKGLEDKRKQEEWDERKDIYIRMFEREGIEMPEGVTDVSELMDLLLSHEDNVGYADLMAKESDGYESYYPICEHSAITKIDGNSHISYIEAAFEICSDIIANPEGERSRDKDHKTGELLPEGQGHGANNIKYAEANHGKFKRWIRDYYKANPKPVEEKLNKAKSWNDFCKKETSKLHSI